MADFYLDQSASGVEGVDHRLKFGPYFIKTRIFQKTSFHCNKKNSSQTTIRGRASPLRKDIDNPLNQKKI